MPLYEYECTGCQAVFEIISRHDALEKPICPFCHSGKTRKLISAVTFRYADHWQQQHMSALSRSQERDEIKKEAQKQVSGAFC